MRKSARNTLLALAVAATPLGSAHAALFDGAENAGAGCHYAPVTSGSSNLGVLEGGPWVVADILENNAGIVGVDDNAAPASQVTITCRLRGGSLSKPIYVQDSQTTYSTGVGLFVPRVVSFDASSAPRYVCTQVEWIANSGYHQTDETCDTLA